jgi:hypothetical protein
MLLKVFVFKRRVQSGSSPEFRGRQSSEACIDPEAKDLVHILAPAFLDNERIKQIRSIISFGIDHAHSIQ